MTHDVSDVSVGHGARALAQPLRRRQMRTYPETPPTTVSPPGRARKESKVGGGGFTHDELRAVLRREWLERDESVEVVIREAEVHRLAEQPQPYVTVPCPRDHFLSGHQGIAHHPS